MTVLRRLARPLLASIFISGGVDALRNPGSKVPAAEGVAPKVADAVPALAGYDTETLVRINGAVQVGAGSLLALGKFPRLSALALAASIVPTTAAGHRFWEADDSMQRAQQRIHFLKNASILGGLLLAAADTDGKPGLGWRAQHTAAHAEAAVERSRRKARRAAKTARREAKLVTKTARAALPV
jgi:putative oxidoreductase